MSRGGYRENAGRKSTWESGRSFAETKLIRVPVEFANQLLELAHKLDAGDQIDLVTDSESSAVREIEELLGQISKLQKQIEQLEEQMEVLNSKSQPVNIISLKEETFHKLSKVAEIKNTTSEDLVEVLINSEVFDNKTQVLSEGFMPVTKLAKRLGVDPKTIRDHRDGKAKPNLIEWTRGKDIDGIGWDYSPEVKMYFPVND